MIFRSVRPFLGCDDVVKVGDNDVHLVIDNKRHRTNDNVAIEDATSVSGGDVNEHIEIAGAGSPRGDLKLPDGDPVELQWQCR